MRIEPRHNPARRRIVERDLFSAMTLGPVPDPVCVARCPDYDPRIGCHRACDKIPARISSDPDLYPLEPLIAPLVFELKRLGVFFPCWSCEGHDNSLGKPWKQPRVWFYAESVVHVRALSTAIDALAAKRLLSVRWRIVVTHTDLENADTTFSLEPGAGGGDIALSRLQADIAIIGSSLAVEFPRACARLKTALQPDGRDCPGNGKYSGKAVSWRLFTPTPATPRP